MNLKLEKSKTRNRKLFALMQRTHMVEKAGTGIIRIREAMKNYKLPAPEIETNSDWFSITFKRPDLQKDNYEQRFYSTTQKTTQKIIELIRSNSKITRAELAKETGLSEDGIKFNLNKLKREGKIKRVGPDKGGHWEVKK